MTGRAGTDEPQLDEKTIAAAMVRDAGDTMLVCGMDGRVLFANRRACEKLGYTREELLSKTIRDIDPEALRTGEPGLWERAVAGERIVFESRHRRKDGTSFEVEVHLTGVDLPSGPATLGIARDITGRKEWGTEYRELIDALNDMCFVADSNGKYVEANKRAVEVLGFSKAELLSMGPADIDNALQSRSINEMIDEMSAGRLLVIETELVAKNGSTIPVEISPSVVSYRGLPAVLGICRDLSDRLRAEEERARLRARLAQAAKMESVGQLAGGVAHDFNNMLGVILGHVELALSDVDPGQPAYTGLQEIRKAAERSVAITQQLLAFARQQVAAPKVIDLNASVEGVLGMLRRLIGEDISLVWLPGENLPQIELDPSQVDQILTNLCVNSRDAIEDTGTITISTSATTLDEAYCAQHEGCVPGDYLMLTVSDTGRGMDTTTLAHLFEPFFTTKGPGRGTGLGLATVYGIVKQNGGYIDVASRPRQGTTFNVFLPPFSGRAVADESVVAAKSLPFGKNEVLLVVEDEPALLTLTERVLASLDYRVLTASLPSNALRLAEEHVDEIDLLITDIVMPEMNGEELAARIHELRPGIKTLYMSGYAAGALTHRGMLTKGVHLLQKPISPHELAAAVRAALDQG